ncbi:hypothetical protein OI450_01775 [Pectobacterium cacticida]|uniref:Lysozyme inhibitor LprI N-terminal domain-containing protein n=1 Tax=Pectobacterium cacticida TaxID=69221 RepID=A0ABZ2G9D9_9GAMM|nr:hypothetical protein [Pectobacterium cacticida]UYX07188.1 hypothetical protein OI450_01775 [Pectobacterium cacticida]
MQSIYLCMLILFAVSGISSAFGEIYLSKLELMDKTLCKDIMKGESYHKIYICTDQMLADSTKNKEVISFLSKLITMKDEDDAVKLFKADQAAWKNYVVHRCAYRGHPYIKDSPVYLSNKDLCEAVENYRRIESLDGELNIP